LNSHRQSAENAAPGLKESRKYRATLKIRLHREAYFSDPVTSYLKAGKNIAMNTQSLLNVEDILNVEAELGASNYKPIYVVLSRGEGVWVWDTDGKRYLDCLSAYSAVNQGHCHPKIRAAMFEQANRLTLTSRAFRNDQLALFYRDICELTNSHKVLPMNSGAEAVETAIKCMRKWGYEVKGVEADKAEIIVCENNFHGRTIGIIGFSSDEEAKANFGPFAPGFTTIPYGDAAALEAAITPIPSGFWSNPFRAKPVSLSRLKAISKQCGKSAPGIMCFWFSMKFKPAWAVPANCWPKNTRALKPTSP